jgi:DNA-binding beta-propeller fold protein YncE
MSRLARLSLILLLVVIPISSPAEEAARAFVLEEKALTVIDDGDFSIKARIPFDPPPVPQKKPWLPYGPGGIAHHTYWVSKDNTRLTVIFRNAFLVFDLFALKLIGQDDLGCMPSIAIRSDDGNAAYVLCSGVEKEKKPSRLVSADSKTGRVVSRLELTQEPDYLSMPDNSTLVAVGMGKPFEKPEKRKPGWVQVFRGPVLESRASLPVPGPVTYFQWDPKMTRLYLTDTGNNDKNPQKAKPGRLYAFDPVEPKLSEGVDIGMGPGPLAWDAEMKVFYLLNIPRKIEVAKPAVLVFNGERVVHRLELPRLPFSMIKAPDHKRFYVLEEKALTIVDGLLQKVEGSIPLGKPPQGVTFMDPPNRAYVLHPYSSAVTSVNLSEGRVGTQITTGRGSIKFLQELGAAAAGMASGIASYSVYGSYWVTGQVIMTPRPSTDALLSRDGRTLFVYNSRTVDITIVDTLTDQVLGMHPGGGAGRRFIQNGKFFVIQAPGDLTLVETETRIVRPKFKIPAWPNFCPDGHYAYAWRLKNFKNWGEEDVALIDLEAGTVKTTFPGVRGPVFFPTMNREDLDVPPSEEPAPDPAAEPAPEPGS